MKATLSGWLWIACAAGAGPAQSVLYHTTGSGGDNCYSCRWGFVPRPIGDVDGDGFDDLLALSSGETCTVLSGWCYYPPRYRFSYAMIVSGADQSTLARPSEETVGAGDVDGDGLDDWISRTANQSWFLPVYGTVTVHTLNGGTLWTLQGSATDRFGWRYGAAGDVDSDGYDDVFVTSELTGGIAPGTTEVRSGADGSVIRSFSGSVAARVGYVDGDQVPDMIVGSPDPGIGRATVYSGADGSVLFSRVGSLPGDGFGADVGSAGDLNGDGRDEFIVSTWQDSTVYSGASGNVLWSVPVGSSTLPPPFNRPGASLVVGVGDLDGDGYDDLATGSAPTIWSGRTRGVLYFEARSGSAVAGIGDFDGDGREDFAVGSTHDVHVRELYWTPAGGRELVHGAACPTSSGTVPRSTVRGRASLGAIATSWLRGAPPGAPIAVHIGTPISAALDAAGMPGCSLYADPFVTLSSVADSGGFAAYDLRITPDIAPSGFTLELQWAALDPGANALGVVLSDATTLVIGP